MGGFNIMNAAMGGLGAGALPPEMAGGGGPGAMLGGGMLPANLMSQIQPSSNPQQAIGGGLGGDPRIMALIQALRGGGGIPGMGR